MSGSLTITKPEDGHDNPSFFAVLLAVAREWSFRWHISVHFCVVLFRFIWQYTTIAIGKIRNPSRPRIAVSMLERLGDIVAAEPIAQYARDTYPNAEICWIVRSNNVEVPQLFAQVDRIISVTCMTEWLLLWASGIFDVSWDLHISERHCSSCHVAFEKPGKRSELTFNRYYEFGNLLAVNCLAAGIPILNRPPRLKISQSAFDRIDRIGIAGQYAVIHCKSSEAIRDWDLQKWRTLIRWLIDMAALEVVEIGSQTLAVDETDGRQRSVCSKLSIEESAALLRGAAIFIGIDSGPAHLANAVCTPGVILLGVYHSFRHYTPYSGGYGDNSLAHLVRAEGPVTSISVDEAIEAASERLRMSESHLKNKVTLA